MSNRWRCCRCSPAARWWGFIGLDDCRAERAWPPAEIDALKVAAGILGAVIQRQQTEETVNRLYETEREQRQMAQALREIGASFSSTLSFDSLLDQILDELPRIVPYDAAYLMLVSPGFGSEPFSALAAQPTPPDTVGQASADGYGGSRSRRRWWRASAATTTMPAGATRGSPGAPST